MDLILWRHAEAESAEGGLPDIRRRLTSRGERHASMVARWLLERITADLRILVGPTLRTQMTAQALRLPFNVEPRIGIGADAAELLAAVAWPDRGGATLVVGHKHTLGRVAALLLSGGEADWSFKKGALWWFSGPTAEHGSKPSLRAVIDPRLITSKGQPAGISSRNRLPTTAVPRNAAS